MDLLLIHIVDNFFNKKTEKRTQNRCMRIEHSVQKSLLGSWKKNSKKQKNEQIEKTVVVFPCFVKNKGLEGQLFFFVHHVAHY